ncbi:DDE_Tnp_IS1595 domain-containing protein [Trichonephila clavipes]|nr:DDE_Tnp_IS1595 domain-containing protein [Trichonephila clavipes]
MFVVDHTIEDAPDCDAASREAAAMVSELRVHAAASVVELFVQTLVVLQTTPILDSGLVTWLHDLLSGRNDIDEDSNHLRREKEREAILREKEKSVVCEERAELVYERIRRRTQFINTAASAASTEEMKRLDLCLEDLMKHMGYSEFSSSLRSIENFPGNRYIIKQRQKKNSIPLNKQKLANVMVQWSFKSNFVLLSPTLEVNEKNAPNKHDKRYCLVTRSTQFKSNHRMSLTALPSGTKTCFSSATLADWRHFVLEQVLDHVELTSSKIGGVGKVVEVDESKFGERKFHKERHVEGQWVFGGVERDSGKLFLVAVHDRTQRTLMEIIMEWIERGTKIILDCWKGYNHDVSTTEGFNHLTVNHSLNFVDPDTGAHTNTIEST